MTLEERISLQRMLAHELKEALARVEEIMENRRRVSLGLPVVEKDDWIPPFLRKDHEH